ncbi:MAG: tetratricopeptide repeat protein [Treponema sp.]|jgi:tetratricopeptide (TPR) repeat protein|nr:tetratricopeptide repeat protein [Treponema sp.]
MDQDKKITRITQASNRLIGLLALFLLAACSSAPKRPAEVRSIRNMAETQLEMVNREADRGNYEEALRLLGEARRLALQTDNPSLLIRTELAQGNVFFSLGRHEEAAEVWNSALSEAEQTGEKELVAITRIYMARRRLLLEGAPAAAAVKTAVTGEMAVLKSDQLNRALGWTIMGLAEKELRRWTEAEQALKQALSIHEQGNYLEQAAYDWYLIASIRSMAGHYDAALEALEQARAFDRRVENTHGLGMDWRALGDVYKKMGRKAEGDAAYRRAADIFRSIDLEKEALEVEARGRN